MPEAIQSVSLDDIHAARDRLRGLALDTPLVRLRTPHQSGEIHLKLENLQPVGSFKLRPIGNSMLAKPAAALAAVLVRILEGAVRARCNRQA